MRSTKLIVRAVLGVSIVALAGSLAWGVVEGRFTAEVAERAEEAAHAAAPALEVEGGVLALSQDRRSISVLDPGNATVRGTIDLEEPVVEMVPTPGGVSVFVTFPDVPEIHVYSTTDYDLQARIPVDGGVPAGLTFSDSGETLFVTYRNSDRVSVFSHAQRELSDPYHFEVSGAAAPLIRNSPLIRNRRATRLYRRSESGLEVLYAQNGAVIRTLQVRAAGWRFTAGFSHLWGVGPDRRPRVVAERSGNITLVQQELAEVNAAAALAVVHAGEGAGGRAAAQGTGGMAALLSGGRAVGIFNNAGAEILAEVELPFAARRISPTDIGTLWALAPDGRVAVIDPLVGETVSVLETRHADVAALVPAIVQEEGSFACF